MNHKDMIEYKIMNYEIILDMHNGYKFLNPNKNSIMMELVI